MAECDRNDVVFFQTTDEMMRKANLDAVAIGTQCHLHTPYAIEVSKYDIPLFLEKPVAVNMEQANHLEKAYETSRCRVIVSFPLRVSPLYELTREYIRNGSVGRPEHIMAVNYVPYGTEYWDQHYRDFSITQGLFVQKATHDFDYITDLMDSKIVSVAAKANYGRVFGGDKPAGLYCSKCDIRNTCPESPQNRRRNCSGGVLTDHLCVFSVDCGSPDHGMNEDCASAILEFASGAHGVYSQIHFSRRDAASRGAIISGYHGTIDFNWYRNNLKWVRHHSPFTSTISAGEGMSHFGGDLELARDFQGLVVRGEKPRTDIWAGIQSIYTCLAAKESAENGRFVAVHQLGS